MTIVTGRDFRANQSRYIESALRGEDVVLKSRLGSVRLVPVVEKTAKDDDRNEITPALARKIARARKEMREGKGVTLHTHEEIEAFFNSL